MADAANLSIYAGDDYAADVTVLQVDGVTPADLTGYTAQAEVRPSLTDVSLTPAATFTTIINGNVISILLTHDDTRLLTKPAYVWDLQVIDSNGWITTLLAGSVAITKEVTKVYAPSVFAAVNG